MGAEKSAERLMCPPAADAPRTLPAPTIPPARALPPLLFGAALTGDNKWVAATKTSNVPTVGHCG